uniref:Transcription initiation factor TFIID subunit 2 n=1 Tax=Steinernema glaseri TaxID=37863 RepID=A0A1I7Z2P7_9BILA
MASSCRVLSQAVKITDVNWTDQSFIVSTDIYFVILDATVERFELHLGQECLLPCERGNLTGLPRGYVRINGQDVSYRRQMYCSLDQELDFYGFNDLKSPDVDVFGTKRSVVQIDLPFVVTNSIEDGKVVTCSIQVLVKRPKMGVRFNCNFGKEGELLPGAHLFTYKTGVLSGTSSWLPCVDELNQLSVWRFEFVLPSDLTAIAPGEISETVSDDTGKKVSFELRVPAAPQNIGFVIGQFTMYQNPDVTEVESYALPRLLSLVKYTVAKSDRNIEFFEELLSCRFPYYGYKQIFVDGIPDDVTSYCGMSLFSVNILYSRKILDVVQKTRYLLAYGVAEQFFGCFVSVNDWADMWLAKGLAAFITGLYIERHFGMSEYLFQIRKTVNTVCDYESRWGKIIVRPTYRGNKPPTPTIEGKSILDPKVESEPPYIHFDPNSADSCSPYYASMLFKKAHLVVRMLQRRIGPEPFNQVLQKIVSVAVQSCQHMTNVPDWDHMLMDTESFFRNVSNVTGHEIPTFLEQWVYDGGHVYFEISYNFNRKRNIVELEFRQEPEKCIGRMSYVGPLTIIIQELDGYFTHQIQIDSDLSKHDLQCHSKGRRQKKKRIPLSNGDEIDVELNNTDNESPVLWVRVDPDYALMRKINLRQPIGQWEYMLRYERDVLAQFQAIDTLQNFPSHQTKIVLQETIENDQLFYRVRCRATFCLAEVDNRLSDTWCGSPVLLNLFTRLYGCKSDPMIPKSHNFSITSSSLQNYFVMHAFPLAMSRLRAVGNVTVTQIHKFLMNLLKLNDNSFNRYSDDFYRATLITAISTNIVYADTTVSCYRPEDMLPEMAETLSELTYALNMDVLKPTYCRVVARSCLYGLFQLQKYGHIPLDPEVFWSYTKPKLFSKLRQEAFTWLVRLLPLTRHFSMNFVFLRLLERAKNDEDPSIRDHIATELNRHPPVHFKIRHKFHFTGVDRVLWEVICDPNAEPRIRCLLRDLYYHMYGPDHRLGHMPPPEPPEKVPHAMEVIRNEQVAWTNPDYEPAGRNPFAIANTMDMSMDETLQ